MHRGDSGGVILRRSPQQAAEKPETSCGEKKCFSFHDANRHREEKTTPLFFAKSEAILDKHGKAYLSLFCDNVSYAKDRKLA